jgi:hypothetical protein
MPDAHRRVARAGSCFFRFGRRAFLCWVLLALLGGNASAEAIRSVHVVVALCDNINQGIVPVPVRIGNGRVPGENLYWGAAYGVKTFFGKQPEWRRVAAWSNPTPQILERLVFKHTKYNVYLVADAWAGEEIKAATTAFLNYAAGREGTRLELPGVGVSVPSGGDASLVVYIGHNGLMDFSLDTTPTAFKPRKAAVFACKSKDYFAAPLEKAGADALILTTNFMCPEAYTTHALIEGVLADDKPEALRERVARAYDKYQKCGLRGARRMFGG